MSHFYQSKPSTPSTFVVKMIVPFEFILLHNLKLLMSLLVFYTFFVCLPVTSTLQRHIIYLHKLRLTWNKDVNRPEQFGFLHNQVTPFFISTSKGQALYTWHILPLGLYFKMEQALLEEGPGLVSDFTNQLAYNFLKYDPKARIVLHFMVQQELSNQVTDHRIIVLCQQLFPTIFMCLPLTIEVLDVA